MKPENIQPRFNQEQGPVYFGGSSERISPVDSPESFEKVKNDSLEVQPKAEHSVDFSAADVTSSLPAPVADNSSDVANKSTLVTSPMIADDKDLIESEWVKAAKKIVSENRDDPYRQEEEFGKLQVDYINKRYGEEIKRN